MIELEDALAEVGADHSPIETVLVRLTELQRRRTRRAAQSAAVGAGLAVAAVAGSIFVLSPGRAAPERVGPATVVSSRPVSNAVTDRQSLDPTEIARRDAELRAQRDAAVAAAGAEAARARAQAQGPQEAGALHREAAALSGCQYLLRAGDTRGVFRAGQVDADAVTRLARVCLGVDPPSALDVSWVVTGMDQLSDALGLHQPPMPAKVAVVQVVGADAQGTARRWLIVLLPDGGHLSIDGVVDGDLSLQLYPSVSETPTGFDLAGLGTVHRP